MQKAYITALCELAEKDRNVLSLLADSGTGYDELFRRYYPDQILDFGIAEENMVSVGAGLAMCGKIPFVYTAGAFLAYRSFEFIRNDVCYQNLNVKIVGMGSGLSWSTLGPSHHTTEDLGALRALPNLTIFSPACPREVKECVRAAYEIKGPVYIKIGMNQEPETGGEGMFRVGKNIELKCGKDICIFTTGSIASEVLKAAELLEEKGISAAVVNVPTIKPFDAENVLESAGKYAALFTVEEQSITGGIGSAVAEVLAENRAAGVGFKRIGLENCFAAGYGTHEQVRRANRLDGKEICERILSCMEEIR